ncbi:Holliday junction resolvase [Corynebacterium mucifaciens]|uniref:Holliday junction resolvase n=2 Tax=Corynebacterium mucifaciens TaxID=57171 RepID=A0ABV2NZ19_9CORY
MLILVSDKKADIVIGLGDGRFMALECKVSNSATNSYKRLNAEAAQKAVRWVKDFGEVGIVPAAVLSGVFNTRNLKSAQNDQLTIFWAHSLDELTNFINLTTARR